MKKIILSAAVVIFLTSACASLNKPTAVDNNTGVTREDNTPTSPSEPTPDISLDLSKQNLDKVPAYVWAQTDLQELNISNNNLTGALPAEIRNLQNLRVLKASHNKMTGVPAEIGQLGQLETLDLSYNQLTGLPYELGNLSHLKLLNLTGNNYSETDLSIIKEKLPLDVVIVR